MKTLDVAVRWLPGALLSTLLSACVGGSGSSSDGIPPVADLSGSAGARISPASQTVRAGDTASFAITADSGFFILESAAVKAVCRATPTSRGDHCVPAVFSSNTTRPSFTATAGEDGGGNISPVRQAVRTGDTTRFTVTPDSGFVIDSVNGCSGSLSGNTYTTAAINDDCSISAVFAPSLSIQPDQEMMSRDLVLRAERVHLCD